MYMFLGSRILFRSSGKPWSPSPEKCTFTNNYINYYTSFESNQRFPQTLFISTSGDPKFWLDTGLYRTKDHVSRPLWPLGMAVCNQLDAEVTGVTSEPCFTTCPSQTHKWLKRTSGVSHLALQEKGQTPEFGGTRGQKKSGSLNTPWPALDCLSPNSDIGKKSVSMLSKPLLVSIHVERERNCILTNTLRSPGMRQTHKVQIN